MADKSVGPPISISTINTKVAIIGTVGGFAIICFCVLLSCIRFYRRKQNKRKQSITQKTLLQMKAVSV